MDCEVGLLGDIHDWCLSRLQAVVHAMYEGDRQQAEQQMAAITQELAAADFSADAHLAAEYVLLNQHFTLVRAFYPRADQQVAFTQVVAAIGGKALGPCSEVMQRIVLLQVYTIGERLGFCEFPPELFHRFFDGIPAAERGDMLWHHVATWAFSHRDTAVMALAYEALVVQPTDFRDQYPYHRANLMYRLLTGRATTRDVQGFLTRMEIINEVKEFEKHILPRVRELGLATADVERLVIDTRVRLEPSTP